MSYNKLYKKILTNFTQGHSRSKIHQILTGITRQCEQYLIALAWEVKVISSLRDMTSNKIKVYFQNIFSRNSKYQILTFKIKKFIFLIETYTFEVV